MWSLTTVRLLAGQAAVDRLWKVPGHFDSQCGRNTSAAGLCGALRHALREGGRLGAAQSSRVGKRGRPRKALAVACPEEIQIAGSVAARRPETSLGDSADGLLVAPWTTGTPSLQIVATRSARPGYPAPTPRSSASPSTRSPLCSPRGASPLAQNLPQCHRRLHLRGATVAEFVGDGLDAPGPGYRDVAALGAHVQPHHRHGPLAVRLRPGSGSTSSDRCFPPRLRAAPAGSRLLLCHSSASASRGQWLLVE